MSDKKQSVQEFEEVKASKNETGFLDRNVKTIIYIAGAVAVLAGGWLLYDNLVRSPREQKASEAMSRAEAFFAQDSLDLALNGDGANAGFLKVISKHDGTKAANLAHYYAGAIYLRKEDYNNAVKHLKAFSTDATQVQSAAWRMLGDALMSLGKQEEGVAYFVKAGKLNEKDEYTSSENLFRAGLAYETMGKRTEAVEMYKIIKEKYPKTEKGFSVDKYLARLGEVK
ncbi:MAG: tetratricopeptide repeat protein [Chitinophagaceae bacterium]